MKLWWFAGALAGCNQRLAVFDVDVHVPPKSVDYDRDQDGIIDDDEDLIGTGFSDPDSDGDGLWDGEELRLGTDPLYDDSDLDLLLDGDEVLIGTDPLLADSDGGGTFDGEEVLAGTDPLDASDDRVVPGERAFAGGGGCNHTNSMPFGLVLIGILTLLVRRKTQGGPRC